MTVALTIRVGRPVIAQGPVSAWPYLACAIGLILASLALMAWLGVWAIAVPFYLSTYVAATVRPRATAVALAGVLIAIEPNGFDFSAPLSSLIYLGPREFASLLPLTIAPFEIALVIALCAVVLQRGWLDVYRGMPWLVAAVPLVVGFGIVYGLIHGAPVNLVYHESRGFIFGICAFILAPGLNRDTRGRLFAGLITAATALAFITIARYVTYVRWGTLPVAQENAFAHDSVIYMMAATVGVAAWLLANRSRPKPWWLFLIAAVLVTATLMTGRRSGTLVGMVGGAALLFTYYPGHKLRATVLTIAALVAMSLYLAAFWNAEYGALAQPARAIESQLTPSARDDSSDTYRDIERYNLMQTIRANGITGIGFGQQFYQYQPLPDLTSFWPLQRYTAHQNVLWLWLKVGLAGLTTIIAVFVLAINRSLRTISAEGFDSFQGTVFVCIYVALLMCLCFATVDVLFADSRSMVVLGLILAFAFQQPPREEGKI